MLRYSRHTIGRELNTPQHTTFQNSTMDSASAALSNFQPEAQMLPRQLQSSDSSMRIRTEMDTTTCKAGSTVVRGTSTFDRQSLFSVFKKVSKLNIASEVGMDGGGKDHGMNVLSSRNDMADLHALLSTTATCTAMYKPWDEDAPPVSCPSVSPEYHVTSAALFTFVLLNEYPFSSIERNPASATQHRDFSATKNDSINNLSSSLWDVWRLAEYYGVARISSCASDCRHDTGAKYMAWDMQSREQTA